MNRYIKNIIALTCIALAVFYALDKAITMGLKKSNMVMYDNLTKIFNGDIEADLIVNGSSKAYVQVNPQVLDSVLQIDSYNLGLDGNAFVPQKLVYELYEEHNGSPKIIVQIVSNATLEDIGNNLYNYIKFAPYLDVDKVRHTMQQYRDYSFLEYRVPLLKYSGHPIEALDGISGLFNIQLGKSPLYKGYLANDLAWDDSFDKFLEDNKKGVVYELNPHICRLFEEYIQDCKKKGIILFLVYPPVYHEFTPLVRNRDQIIEYYTKISNKYEVPFFDYSEDEISRNKKYFYNSQHLNAKAADYFTKILAIDIKQKLLEQKIN